MQIGAIFPQTELEADAGAIREYAVAVEEMGFTHISAYDHVLGASTASRPDWNGPYRYSAQFPYGWEAAVIGRCLARAQTRR